MALTESEIDQLTGRELDAAVAEHIFGLRVEGSMIVYKRGRKESIPDYSLCESLAAEVREAVRKEPFNYFTLHVQGETGTWKAKFCGPYDFCNHVIAYAENAASATCKAALKLATRGKG